jgi:hypothetical protein
MPMKRVAEVSGSNIVLKRMDRKRKTQKFFFDQTTKTVKSVNNKNWSLNIAGNGNSANLQMTTTNSRWW